MGLRCAGTLAGLASIGVTRMGNVPINIEALSWQPSDPPPDWKASEERWDRFDTVRVLAAVAAFVLFLTGVGLRHASMEGKR